MSVPTKQYFTSMTAHWHTCFCLLCFKHILLFLYESFAFTGVCESVFCLVPTETRRGYQTPGTGVSHYCELGIEPGSSLRPPCTPHH